MITNALSHVQKPAHALPTCPRQFLRLQSAVNSQSNGQLNPLGPYAGQHPADHMRAVDAHFDSLSRAAQARARKQGFKPYRELPKSGDTIFELDEAKACHRLRMEQGQDAATRQQTFDRAQVLAILAVVSDSIGRKRCPKPRDKPRSSESDWESEPN